MPKKAKAAKPKTAGKKKPAQPAPAKKTATRGCWQFYRSPSWHDCSAENVAVLEQLRSDGVHSRLLPEPRNHNDKKPKNMRRLRRIAPGPGPGAVSSSFADRLEFFLVTPSEFAVFTS